LVRKELYLINKQTVSTMIFNLGVLLGGDRTQEENDGEVFLPTEDVLSVIANANVESIEDNSTTANETSDGPQLRVNELCGVVWEYRGKLNWYLGYVTKLDGEFAEVEHLERISPSNNGCWQYPNYTDTQPVDTE
jgi:hypothetical protein